MKKFAVAKATAEDRRSRVMAAAENWKMKNMAVAWRLRRKV